MFQKLDTIKFIIKSSVFFLYVNTFCFAQNFNIDLSNQIQKEVTSSVVNLNEKSRDSIQWLKYTEKLSKTKLTDIYTLKITSYTYTEGSLNVQVEATLNEGFSGLIKEINFLRKVDIDSLTSKINIYRERNKINPKEIEQDDVPLVGLRTVIMSNLLRENLGISVYDAENKLIFSKSFEPNLIELFGAPLNKLILSGDESDFKNHKINFSLAVSRQVAVSIKSLRIEGNILPNDLEKNWGKILEWNSILGVKNILESLNSSNPVNSYLRSVDQLIEGSQKVTNFLIADAFRNKKFNSTWQLAAVFYFVRANVADNAVIYQFYKNVSDSKIAGLIGDHESIFTVNALDGILNRKRGPLQKKGNFASETGCERHLPKNYTFKSDNLFKNIETLLKPDSALKVVVGRIDSITNSGGIIKSTELGQNLPILYTKTNNSVIVDQDKISVKTQVVRVFGSYDSNSKIEMTNQLGAKRIIDAPNLNLICMEVLYSDDDLINLVFGAKP
jgi:hypothetical protein